MGLSGGCRDESNPVTDALMMLVGLIGWLANGKGVSPPRETFFT